MADIVLTAEQAQIVAHATGNIVLRDPEGRLLGYVSHGFTAKDIEEAKQRLAAPGERSTTAEVLAQLQELSQK